MIVSAGALLTLVTIGNRGNLPYEFVQFEVKRDGDLGYYVLLATIEKSPGRILAGSRPAFWFESQRVATGDCVVVHTRTGTYTRSPRPDGHMVHYFYWGMPAPLFAAPSARVVIAELNVWQTAG